MLARRVFRGLVPIAQRALGRSFYTLGIETSCDDTSVAILEIRNSSTAPSSLKPPHAPPPAPQPYSLHARLLFHEKVTADNSQYGGIHPVAALHSHQANLGCLLEKALSRFGSIAPTDAPASPPKVPPRYDWKPDLVAVTRGPGMRSNLSIGLDTAKGLALAWKVPLVAVNHMQAHALTPRLVTALSSTPVGTLDPLVASHPVPSVASAAPCRSVALSLPTQPLSPAFPFLSLLVSGGHTLLLHSISLTQHSTLATTSDIAVGDALDKIARSILPPCVLESLEDIAYARALEHFVFPSSAHEYAYAAPATRQAELERRPLLWGWALGIPLAETRSGSKSKSMEFCFTGLDSSVRRIVGQRKEELGGEMSVEERRDLGREAMRVTFEHLASRVVLALQGLSAGGSSRNVVSKASELINADGAGMQALKVDTLVVSGGVASNRFLRTVLRAFLDARSLSHVKLSFPPVELCTDNAAMIAWTGYEMLYAGHESQMSCRALRKWTLDENAKDGGILGVDGWRKAEETI